MRHSIHLLPLVALLTCLGCSSGEPGGSIDPTADEPDAAASDGAVPDADANAPTPVVVRILPLGDSLTDGQFYAPGGYRIRLWELLEAEGVAVDFVGSEQNGPDTLPDRDHEGHNGWRIDEISEQADAWLALHRPDIILLMIGTNDMLQGHALDEAPTRLSALLDQLRAGAPDAHIVVAAIPPLVSSALVESQDPELAGTDPDERVVAYNAAVADVVTAHQSKGSVVSFADMHTLDKALLVDGIHPKQEGYDVMAGVWHAALQPVLGQ